MNKQFLEIIKKHYPTISEGKIKFLDDGWDHYVFVIDGKTAFRFPRTSEDGKKDAIETEFFKLFAPTSPVPVQNMKLFNDEETGIRYQMYDFIQGIRFTRDLAKTFSEEELSSIATDLGKFLTVLHSFPLDKGREMYMDEIVSAEDYVDYWEDFLKEIRNTMYQHFSKDEQEWIEKIFQEYITQSRKYSFSVTVTHFDLLPEHILVDEKTHKLSGIIDFSLRITDPAYDFSYFDRYGKHFLNAVLESYPLRQGDETFDIRRKFYATRLGFSFLSQAIERQPEKIPVIIDQIHEYIRLNQN